MHERKKNGANRDIANIHKTLANVSHRIVNVWAQLIIIIVCNIPSYSPHSSLFGI